jgi:hypothetical protein
LAGHRRNASLVREGSRVITLDPESTKHNDRCQAPGGVRSLELLANPVHGPSFVSLDSALSFHGLIPERVAARILIRKRTGVWRLAGQAR